MLRASHNWVDRLQRGNVVLSAIIAATLCGSVYGQSPGKDDTLTLEEKDVRISELEQRLREAQNPAELGFVLVNDTQALAPYRSAVLWLVGQQSPDKGKISSVSGAVDQVGVVG